MTKPLPDSPNLEQFKNQAKELLKSLKVGYPEAANRFIESHPEFEKTTLKDVFNSPLNLADAQIVLAREYGYPSWPKLKAYIDSIPLHGKLKSAIDANDVALVKQLIRGNPELIQAPIGYAKQGPLTWAAECRGPATPPTVDRLEIARFLISAGADIHELGDSPLMRAALNGGRIPMMELLLSYGADVNAHWNGNYPIILAPCETVNPVGLKWLLDHGADPNPHCEAENDWGSPLDMVIGTYSRSRNQSECIDLLINAGGTGQYSAFPSMFIHRGRLDLLKESIDADPDLVHQRFPELYYGSTGARNLTLKGCTLLHVATEYGDLLAAKLLVSNGADVNATAMIDNDGVGGQTPIYHAVTQHFDYALDTARFLIESGADLTVRAKLPSAYDKPDETVEVTPLGYAARFPGKQWETSLTFDLLREFGAPAGDIYTAAKLGMIDELKDLLAAGGDRNSSDPYGETAIQAAQSRGHANIVELLSKT